MGATPMDSLKLSVQRALLGEVAGNLAALTAGFDGPLIRLVAYFFTAPTEEERETIESAAAEVIADFHADYNIEATCHALGDGVPKMIDFWAFVRAGVRVS